MVPRRPPRILHCPAARSPLVPQPHSSSAYAWFEQELKLTALKQDEANELVKNMCALVHTLCMGPGVAAVACSAHD